MTADDCRLAWRFALASQAKYRWRLLISSLLVFVGVTVLFAAIAVVGGFAHIQTVAQARSMEFAESPRSARALVSMDLLRLGDEQIEVLKVAPLPGRPTVRVPGLTQLPPTGSYAVSPAVADEVAQTPGLQNLIPIAGIISGEGLASGEERYAVRTVEPWRLKGPEQVAVTGFGGGQPLQPATMPDVPLWAPAVAVFLLLGLPATLLLAAAAGLASAVREHRLSLMQRLGGRARGRRIAAVETTLLTMPGLALAPIVWWAVLGRADAVPVVGSRLLDDAWQVTPTFALALGFAVLVLVVATIRLARPREDPPRVGAADRVGRSRSGVLVLGIFLLLVTPWLSVNARSDVFLLAVVVSALGVVLALPRWTRGWGALLRNRASSLPLFLVGARLQRFPVRVARGWASLAVACAIFAPALVMVNLQSLGDTDATPSTPGLHAFQVRLDGGDQDLQSLRQRSPGHFVGWYEYAKRDLVLSGTCRQAASAMELPGCSDLRRQLTQSLTWVRKVRFRQAWNPDRSDAIVLGASDQPTLATLAAAAGDLEIHEATALEVPPPTQSPLVPWLVGGIGTGVAIVLLAILTVVTDRAMTARRTTTLGRIGLSLGRRRLVDALAFTVCCGITALLGLGLGLLSAVVLSRNDLTHAFPWQGLTGIVAAVAVIAVVGGTAVAIGTTTASPASVGHDESRG